MNNKVTFFLPTRKGSQRVKDKNTRPFAGIEGGIFKLKLQQLLNVERVSEIVVSTNDERTMDVARSFHNDKIRIVERPESLCLSSTVIEDFINYIPTIIESNHIFWVHATAPFANEEILNNALDAYERNIMRGKYDSLLSVNKIQQFLWSAKENKCINHDRTKLKWPRTQDLEPLYEINHAFYISSRENYLKFHDRIGMLPYLFELDKLHAYDIDWEDDFAIAEMIYKFCQNEK